MSARASFRLIATLGLLAALAAGTHGAHAEDSSDFGPQDGRTIVSIGHDAVLAQDERADDVVAILGSARVAGEVSDAVVAVLGDADVTGSVSGNTVVVLGDVYVNSKVSGNVVAVWGNVTLGPQAQVDGQIVELLGTLSRSPTAILHGGTVRLLPGVIGGLPQLHAWVRECLLYGRPLAPDLSLGWVWGIALATLGLYLLLAALFHDGVRRCVATLEEQTGQSVLAAIIAAMLTPLAFLVLLVSVVGIAIMPVLWAGLLCLGIFGRVVALGWIGKRCRNVVSTSFTAHPVADVLCGGLIVLALYMVPLLGFLVYALIGVIGFGAVVYTLVLSARAARAHPAPAGAAPAGAGAPWAASAAAASAAASGQPSGPAAAATAGAASTENAGEGAAAAAQPQGPPAGTPAALNLTALPRAGFWIRMCALVLDVTLVGFVLSLLRGEFRSELIFLAAYGAVMWKLRGTTVGGIICDLKVARMDGRPIDWSTAVVRALACFLSLAIVGLGFVWIALDPEHQAWHDKIAGTVVVRVPRGGAP